MASFFSFFFVIDVPQPYLFFPGKENRISPISPFPFPLGVQFLIPFGFFPPPGQHSRKWMLMVLCLFLTSWTQSPPPFFFFWHMEAMTEGNYWSSPFLPFSFLFFLCLDRHSFPFSPRVCRFPFSPPHLRKFTLLLLLQKLGSFLFLIEIFFQIRLFSFFSLSVMEGKPDEALIRSSIPPFPLRPRTFFPLPPFFATRNVVKEGFFSFSFLFSIRKPNFFPLPLFFFKSLKCPLLFFCSLPSPEGSFFFLQFPRSFFPPLAVIAEVVAPPFPPPVRFFTLPFGRLNR